MKTLDRQILGHCTNTSRSPRSSKYGRSFFTNINSGYFTDSVVSARVKSPRKGLSRSKRPISTAFSESQDTQITVRLNQRINEVSIVVV